MRLTDLKVLSQKDMDLIHQSSLDVLEKIGLIVESRKVLDILKEGGCDVDYDTQLVKFPKKVVKKCIKTLPSKINLYDRDGNLAITLGDGGRYCASGHNAVFTLLDESGARRDSTVKDVEDFAIISDYLSEVDVVGVPVMPQDATPQTTLLYAIKAILENSKKPVFFSSESEYINQAAIEMGKIILGKESLAGGSNLISQLSTTSPLYWERGAVEALYVVAKEGIPVDFLPQPITGVTAPYTLAGILTIHNTEVLSGIVIAQMINPGTPVIYGAAWTTYEMKLSSVLIGRPESSLLRIAGAQMAHYYNIPSHTTSPDNDSNVHDEQAAWEKILSIISGIIGANDMIVNLGMFGTGMTISMEQLVMDNEMCRIVRRFLKGIEVSEDTIAFDTIANVGPRGTYLMEEHTLENLKSGEHVELSISNAAIYEMWKSKGSKNVVQKAQDKVLEILEKGNKCPLQPEIKQKLADIISKYENLIVK
ncbi:MAG: trimethylamine methyltransferase family protein [Clostridiales bacterium]|nr:trimethylamine methyltransferase family protein [Clostridiales bacterium]